MTKPTLSDVATYFEHAAQTGILSDVANAYAAAVREAEEVLRRCVKLMNEPFFDGLYVVLLADIRRILGEKNG